jgi:hypothetical protein
LRIQFTYLIHASEVKVPQELKRILFRDVEELVGFKMKIFFFSKKALSTRKEKKAAARMPFQ